jgi:hypothetical protein
MDALQAFYCETLGFGSTQVGAFAAPHVFLTTDSEGSQFIYVAEHAQALIVGGDDHLGLHMESREAVDAIRMACEACKIRDPRMQIKDVPDLDLERTLTHAFYFRYLLPIWFDIQIIEYKQGFEPKHRWVYG